MAEGGQRERGRRRAPSPREDEGPAESVPQARAATIAKLLGEVAQLVEHTTENRGVAGSIPALAIWPAAPRRLPASSVARVPARFASSSLTGGRLARQMARASPRP